MGARQPVRGNPESRSVYLIPQFFGGVNLTYSDDLIPSSELRYLTNYDLDSRGQLRSRKGFGVNRALSDLYFNVALPESDFPPMTKTDSHVRNYIIFKILEDTNLSWKKLSESDNLAQFQAIHCTQPQTIKTLLIAEMNNGVVRAYIHKFVISVSGVTRTYRSEILPFSFKGKDNLMNINHAEQYNKLFFTSNDKGIVVFDYTTDQFSYIGNFGVGVTNVAYKPNALEARKIGFNLLADSPLDWVSRSSSGFSGIEAVYISSMGRVPLLNIPPGESFYINVFFTGVVNNFKFTFKDVEGDVTLDATVVKNNSLSIGTLAVYKVDFLTQPTQTVEITVLFDSPDVFLNPYIDVYELGVIPENAKPVLGFNVGDYGVVQVFDRIVLYNKNTLLFSEINNFAYVPSFNFILLPISNTDEIVKISYFRSSYIIFTKQKIFRLSGTFGAQDFSLALINDEVGCISPNSVTLVENEIYFLSTRGLRSLKTDLFRENLENLRAFDEKIHPIVTDNEQAYGIVYEDQFVLFSNIRGNKPTTSFGERVYTTPDILRQYYRTGAFVIDFFPNRAHPRFIFFESGKMYSFMSNPILNGLSLSSVYKFGSSFSDFGEFYDLVLETSGLNFGYPIHEKKIKNIILKMTGEAGLKSFFIKLYSNGHLSGEVNLQVKPSSGTADIESSQFRLDKERIPARFKNLSLVLSTDSSFGVNISSISYIFRLGKVRD